MSCLDNINSTLTKQTQCCLAHAILMTAGRGQIESLEFNSTVCAGRPFHDGHQQQHRGEGDLDSFPSNTASPPPPQHQLSVKTEDAPDPDS